MRLTIIVALPNVRVSIELVMWKTYLRTGLERAIGVATPRALIRCCMVGVAEVIRIAAPCWFVFGPLISWSGDNASGLYPRDTSRPLLIWNHQIQSCDNARACVCVCVWSQNKREKRLEMGFGFFVVVVDFMINANEIQQARKKRKHFFYTQDKNRVLCTK